MLLLQVLEKPKGAIAWKMLNIKGISASYCTHKILIEDDYKPVIQPERRLNPKVQDVVKNEIVKLLDSGLIYLIVDSLWVSPIHMVPKKGGMTVLLNDNNELISSRTFTGWRVCIDYHKLNVATQKDHLHLPFIDKMRQQQVTPVIIAKDLSVDEKTALIKVLKSQKQAIAWKLTDIKGIDPEFCSHKILLEEDYEPKIDLPNLRQPLGYFQIPINPKDQEKTTFTCPYGTFAYKRMPFGLCNAPGTFQWCMMAIFHDMIEQTMEVFMDDFSVFGIVLGHKILEKGIEVDKDKIEVISKLPHPTTVKGIRSFLRHAGFYQKFIKDFFKISRPMTHLLEKNALFVFSDDCVQAFRTLKEKLTEAPILIAPDWDQPFELMCDASDFAVGAVLGQRIEKHFRPIHYASKTMIEAESN
nr:reverse transcriptase domain-containing protein [Tanacetum cinerariifolium]